MNDYSVFGGRLRSELEFPGLPYCRPAESEPVDWTLEIVSGPAREPSGRPLGEDRVTPDANVRLHRDGASGDLLLAFDDTGVFRVSPDGARIRWTPSEGAVVDDARLDIIGRVLPLALHLQGMLVLHASAVLMEEGAVAFVGPKGHGKSTLAHALVRQEAVLLTDDALPVRPDPAPVALSGVRRIRLRPDVVDRLPGLERPEIQRGGRTEIGFDEDDAGLRERLPVPLARIYLLDPRPADEDLPTVACERVDGPHAVASLLSQAKLGPLFASWRPEVLLRGAVSLVGEVPVRRLTFVRELSRLDEVATLLLDCAGTRSPDPTPGGRSA